LADKNGSPYRQHQYYGSITWQTRTVLPIGNTSTMAV
jgi:hypothetical protein